jgi:zinc D-Ala-D-Ala dipeptidase
VVFDAYRPWSITCLFWKLTPPEKHAFVADPAKGSQHNRGCAVDVSLVERATGREVDMPSTYDEMSERSAPDYTGGTAEQRARRDRLRRAMEQQGFSVYSSEWWHFEYRDCGNRPLLDIPLAGLSSGATAPEDKSGGKRDGQNQTDSHAR